MRDKATKAAKEQDVKAKTADETTTLHVTQKALSAFCRQIEGFTKPFNTVKKGGKAPSTYYAGEPLAGVGYQNPWGWDRDTKIELNAPESTLGFSFEYTYPGSGSAFAGVYRLYCPLSLVGKYDLTPPSGFDVFILTEAVKAKKKSFTVNGYTFEVVQ